MSPDYDRVTWEDVATAASKMFHVWCGDGEIKWVEECWRHLGEAGLTEKTTLLEETATYLRLVTLAQVYEEFCGCAWDENPDSSLSDFADELEINPLALGILGATASPDAFDDAAEDYELRNAALFAISDSQRPEIFACLCKAYGGDVQLYSRMSKTNQSASDEDDGDEFEVTGSNGVALSYVMNGFRQG